MKVFARVFLLLLLVPSFQVLAQPAAAEKPAGASLLLGKAATASSEETGKDNFAKHAVDGVLDTRWCASGPASGEWIRVDLGEVKDIRALRIHWESDNAAYRYTVSGSANGEQWQTLVDASENDKRERIVEHTIDATEVRYLEVKFLGSSSGSWGSVWELEAYAGDLPELPEAARKPGSAKASIADVKAPDTFDVRMFASPPQVGYPVCLTTAPNGDVYIGVDEQGSLGKEAGRGKIVRCRDIDGDGTADEINTFATVDHPRGLVYDQGNLWVLHPPMLTLYRDHDLDGTADEQETLITGISTDQVQRRGADHTTNGIRMGIDGWIYIAVGDFGFNLARGADGKELSRRGGGIVRVRPDGTEMEIFAWGLRNVLDVCIDPYLNMFTRDNTNDGGGWDVRLSHILQGAYYGYPSKYINFADETMPPLADYGGGSGCGAMYVFEPRWPEAFGDAAYTCDWGTSKVYRHRLPASGASFLADQDIFLDLPRPTDIDVDASGRMYVSSWKNGGFSFSDENVGFVAQLMPQGFVPKPFPELGSQSDDQLLEILRDGASVRSLHVQRELLRRGRDTERSERLLQLVRDAQAPLAGRVAALFTLKQLDGADSHPALVQLAVQDKAMKEFALRALTDRQEELDQLSPELFLAALRDADPRVQAQSLISLARLASAGEISDPNVVAREILPLTVIRDAEGATRVQAVPHDQADVPRVIPHLAMQAVIALEAGEAAVQALDGPARSGALRALRNMHQPEVVSGVIARLQSSRDAAQRRQLLDLLARLYFREGPYTKGDWWGTRPDTSGPYYDRQTWSESARIEEVLRSALKSGAGETVALVEESLQRYKISFAGDDAQDKKMEAVEEKAIVIAKADPNNPNLIGNLPQEEVIAHVMEAEGQSDAGKPLFTSQSCVACHTDAPGQTPKGPHLVDIGKRYKREELVESLLKPSAKLAQGFETWSILTDSGQLFTGFVVSESAETVTIRQNDGLTKEIRQDEIELRRKQERSMMPEGLVDNLTVQQFANLVAYLESLKEPATGE